MCIPTSVDPNNCGGCGHACTGAMACSGGACETTCLPGLTLCANDHTCSDTSSDNGHCGSCTNACPMGQGCVAGSCVPSIPLPGTPPMCAGGGPPIVNPPGQGGCLGGLAATTFRWTICSCKDVSLMDLILVDAFNSQMGPYMPGGIGGGVGADNQYLSSSASVPPTGGIWGDLWVGSPMGLNNGGDDVVKHECRSAGQLTANGSLAISADAYAEGNVSNVTIGGKLYVPASANVSVTPGGGIVRGPISWPPPCDCAANQLVPVTSMVQYASTNNNNAMIGLNANVLASPGGPSRLDLPCGSYYLTSVRPGVPVTIWAHGQTALYIGQDVAPMDELAFGVDPNGAFDVFIAGTLSTQSKLTIGSPNYPALMRTYIGSTSGVSFSSEAIISGNIYAAFGPVDWSAGTDAFGSVFAGNFTASAAARIHYDAAVLNSGSTCPPPGGNPPPDGGTSGSSGSSSGGSSSGSSGSSSGGTGCTAACCSCRDCLNQACVNGQCGSCTTTAECCSPLICQAGTCVPVLH
jgi:hypothetical protein